MTEQIKLPKLWVSHKDEYLPAFFCNQKTLAKMFGTSARMVAKWRTEGMPCYLYGEREIRFNVAEAENWVKENKKV